MFGDNRDKIVINENAYFYTKKHGDTISKTRINNTFALVSKDKLGNFLLKEVRQQLNLGGKSTTYSFCVFKSSRKPSIDATSGPAANSESKVLLTSS